MSENLYQSLYDSYEWLVPGNANIADLCCHRWSSNPHEARQTAIYFEDQVGQLTRRSYHELSAQATKLARALQRMGVHPQDRVLVITQHSIETAICLLAILTIGAIAVPLQGNLSAAQYQSHFNNTQARIAIIDQTTIHNVTSAIDHLSPVKQLIGINTEDERIIRWHTLLARQSTQPIPTNTTPDTPAILFHHEDDAQSTVITHGQLIGCLPGFVCSQNWFPKNNDILWSSYGFNTYMGIMHSLLPVLYFGRTIVACPAGRTIPRLFQLLEHYQITHIILSADELSRIKHNAIDFSAYELNLQCISGLAQEMTPELEQWVKDTFNIQLNRFISTKRTPFIAGDSCKWPHTKGAYGKVYPGHQLTVLNAHGNPVQTGQKGFLAIRYLDPHQAPDPVATPIIWSDTHFSSDNESEWQLTNLFVTMDKHGTIRSAS